MCPLSRSSHKDPIDHITLSCLRQEIRPVIVGPQQPRFLVVASAPPNIPGFTWQIGSSFLHVKNFLQRVQSRFVREIEAVVYLFAHFVSVVEIGEEIEVEFL